MVEKIDIVITDDHKLFRKGIFALLSDFEFVGEIYEAGNGIELLKLLSSLKALPKIILLDLNMPEMDGMEAQKKIRELYPEIKIIILTMEDDEQYILHLINEGVNGYLLKNADPDEVEIALKKVLVQEFYFPENISRMILRNLVNKEQPKSRPEHEITDRELHILQLICEEKTATEIAEELALSARTVEGYKRKLFEKTGTKNMAGLVLFAVKNNLISI
ncbi:MAG: response regulator transcription factor [Draconibacterium sp.]